MIPSKNVVSLLSFGCLVACGSDPKPPPTAPTGEMAMSEPPVEEPADDTTRSDVRIAPDIARACGINEAEAHFAFDSANVRTAERTVLQKLAKCFTDGPLKGKQMRLVGRADPRGESEYNMVLGGKRADSVSAFLTREGLPGSQVSTTSRGELDAIGSDEPGWAADRRVDVLLAD